MLIHRLYLKVLLALQQTKHAREAHHHKELFEIQLTVTINYFQRERIRGDQTPQEFISIQCISANNQWINNL